MAAVTVHRSFSLPGNKHTYRRFSIGFAPIGQHHVPVDNELPCTQSVGCYRRRRRGISYRDHEDVEVNAFGSRAAVFLGTAALLAAAKGFTVMRDQCDCVLGGGAVSGLERGGAGRGRHCVRGERSSELRIATQLIRLNHSLAFRIEDVEDDGAVHHAVEEDDRGQNDQHDDGDTLPTQSFTHCSRQRTQRRTHW